MNTKDEGLAYKVDRSKGVEFYVVKEVALPAIDDYTWR